ncbi:MAG TPA: SdpI family protein [Selenomonadales bacterium]|nr:SdpI family protein [Selenomonadales bacterium]
MPPLVMVAMGVLQIALGLFAYYVRIARNFFVGYRTARSMASEEAWLYANRTFGKLCGMAGAFDLLVGIGGAGGR